MAKPRKSKAKGARNSHGKGAKRVAVRAKQAAARAKAALKAKPARKDLRAAVVPPKALVPAKGKVPQKMDKAALRKALLDERLARAQAKVKGGRRSTRGLTAKERALVKEFERRELSPADAEARRERLKNLIVLGKERSYLTYAEINDHLPDDM
ncbi:MAG: RNA polymerase sigma factor region1.1 domain-containing protein, partial [Gammaproteobacteria bacterium]